MTTYLEPCPRSAGPIWSGLFVAPVITTRFLTFMPSISVRAWLRIRSPEEPLRAFVIEYNVEDIMHSATARALSNEIREDMSSTDLLQVDIVSELHVLRVSIEDLETVSGVRDTDVDLAVEPTELTEDRVNRVGGVSAKARDGG